MTERDKRLQKFLEQFLLEGRTQQFDKVINQRTNHFTIGVEDIYQPHNASAILRSCDCFGIQNMHIIETFNKFEASKGVSKGARKWVDLNYYKNSESAVEQFRKQGYQIVATSPRSDAIALNDFDVTKKSIFLFGQEKKGLSQYLLDQADILLHIPMVGHTESLNISVSAAIVMQNVTNRLRINDVVHWQLTEEEKEELRFRWIKKNITKLPKLIAYFDENDL